MSREPLFAFTELPPEGKKLWISNAPYTLVDRHPYVNSERHKTYILTWRGPCIDCGMTFDQTTGMLARQLVRRCDRCLRAFKKLPENVRRERGRKAWGEAINLTKRLNKHFEDTGELIALRVLSTLWNGGAGELWAAILFNDRQSRAVVWSATPRNRDGSAIEADFGRVREALDAELEETLAKALF